MIVIRSVISPSRAPMEEARTMARVFVSSAGRTTRISEVIISSASSANTGLSVRISSAAISGSPVSSSAYAAAGFPASMAAARKQAAVLYFNRKINSSLYK